MQTAELKPYFVVFLDILGFTEMVRSDVGNQSNVFLKKLFKCHQGAAHIFGDDPSCSITQFSDSIVVAKPYDPVNFEPFIRMVGNFQRLLLDESLLCRGGIAVNKHFSNGSFTFSAGLIDAYYVESKTARFPRVVISPEVMDLVYPNRQTPPPFLIEEDDGLFFVDYLGLTAKIRPKTLQKAITSVVADLLVNSSPSVREKGMWIAAYSDAILGTQNKVPRFSGKHVRN